MMNDPISDMLTRIRNSALANQATVNMPFSKLKEAVAQILIQEGYLISQKKTGESPKYELQLVLSYKDKMPAVSGIKRMSKPGLRLYVNCRNIPKVMGGMGLVIMSTPQGVMTGKEAFKRKLGGEVMCEVW